MNKFGIHVLVLSLIASLLMPLKASVASAADAAKDEVVLAKATDAMGTERVKFAFCEASGNCRPIGAEVGYSTAELAAMQEWAKSQNSREFWKSEGIDLVEFGLAIGIGYLVGKYTGSAAKGFWTGVVLKTAANIVSLIDLGKYMSRKGQLSDLENKLKDKNPWFKSQASLAKELDAFFAEAYRHVDPASGVSDPSNLPSAESLPLPLN